MRFHGREVDPIALWSEYCEIQEDDGPFLPLTHCPNPEHDNSRSPAFQINIEKPLVHCFAKCGISGTYEHAIQMIEGCTRREAKRKILRHSRIARKPVSLDGLRRNSKRSKLDDNAEDRKAGRLDDLERFSYLPPVASDYLSQRGITSASIARWELGWDSNEKRIVLPVRDSRGRIAGLIRRAVLETQHPKYLYTDGFSRNVLLYGGSAIDLGMVKSEGLIVVEGSFDAIKQHQNGFPNTVAMLGTGISKQQGRLIQNLRPKRVILMFDKDLAGIWSIESAKERLSGVPLYVCRYPKDSADPDELTRKEAHRIVERAIPLTLFLKKAGLLPNVKSTREAQQIG